MTNYLIPIIIAIIFLVGIIKNVDIFQVFIKGAIEGLKTSISIFPILIGIIAIISMLESSGFLNYMCKFLEPIFSIFNLPSELIPLALLRPISGSGTLSFLEQIFKSHSPDSTVGLIASVLAGSSETTFYTIAIYFGAVNISKTKYALPAALIGDFVGMIMSVISVNLLC